MSKKGTIFCDIDGTILFHEEDFMDTLTKTNVRGLPGAAAKLAAWHCAGFKIILTTARPESCREITIKQLAFNSMTYDQLIMGVGQGPRYVINDLDPNDPGSLRAYSINVHRNKGIGDSVYIPAHGCGELT